MRLPFVFQLVEGGCFLEVTTEIGELVIPPYLLQAKLSALLLVPRVVKVELSGILAAILLSLSRFSLTLIGYLCFSFLRFPLRLVQLGGGDKDRQRREFVFASLIAGCDKDFRVEMGVAVARYFLELKRVFVSVVRNDMHVRGRVRDLRFDRDEAARYMAAVEYPGHSIAAKKLWQPSPRAVAR